MDTNHLGVMLVSFIVLVTTIGMGSIIISMVLDKDTIEHSNYDIQDSKKKNKSPYLETLQLEEDSYDVIIEDQ